ncbi:hypothetical protein OEZ86_002437 [Tetradesmus obliquus]|nr:hypothetical protein OEZ86_002437 [Tetradesmus obliquus]
MFALRPVFRLCRGICQSSHCPPARQGLGTGFRPISVPALQSRCFVRPGQHWLRPSTTLLAETSQQVLQYGSIHSAVATLSSLQSAADLSAAIAAAPSQAALQSLAAEAAAVPQQSWLAQEYKVQLLASLEQQEASALVKALTFYARLGPEHADLFQEAVPVLYNRLGQLSPKQLLRTLGAFAAAAQHSPAAYSQELFVAATEFLWEGLGQLEPCALADVAAAYAAVQHYDDDEDFFNGLAAAALQQLQAFCPEDLSRLVASLAKLRFTAPELNAAALQQMAAQVEGWPLSCIGRLLGALAAVQANPDPCVLDRVAGHVSIVLRNLRTSTDGQRVLASLGARGSAAAAAKAAAAASKAGDGKVTTTYIKRSEAAAAAAAAAAASPSPSRPSSPSITTSSSSSSNGDTSSSSSSSSPSNSRPSSPSSAPRPTSSKASRGGLVLPPSSRALSSSSSSNSSGEGGSWTRQQQHQSLDECPVGNWQQASMAVPGDCRPVYDDAEALQAALVNLSWAFAMLGHLHSTLAKECFKGLALVAPEAFGDDQLAALWGAQLRYQQLGHVMLDPNPLLADSYSVFLKEISRAAPRTISLPSHLQPLAAANWLLHTVRAAPEYERHPQQEQQQHDGHGGHHPQQQQPLQQQHFSSWKFRDPAVLTQRGLEASVRQTLLHLGLPVGEPCITLDGVVRVGLPLKHSGVSVAWQVVPPAWCSRNPPYTPTAEAQAQKWALQYRGYTVLQVPFHEWSAVLDSGDVAVQAGYLQHMLNGLSVRIPRMSNF